ncbi:uncharacterized protein LOC121382372 [Gigantopelta aegis]|uniref:uncharacterized protein LOC121382372 n=1 Tax=Gigantopelta aegis TaxID=1735272 RepID=UPI001B88740E|nr:uncharacterized protein LOC121382372 [Gigantopelta aegis]
MISVNLEHKHPSDGQQLAAAAEPRPPGNEEEQQPVTSEDVSGTYRQKQIYDELDANIARLKDIDIKRNNAKAKSPVVIKVDKDVDIHVVHQDSTANSQQGLQADDHQNVHIQGSPQKATISLKLQSTHSSDEQLAAADVPQQPVTSEDVSGKYPQKQQYGELEDGLDAIIARLEAINFKRKHPEAVVIKVDRHVDVHVAGQGSNKNSQQGLQADDHQSVHIQQGSPQKATISLKLQSTHSSENKDESDGHSEDEDEDSENEGGFSEDEVSVNEHEVNDDEGGFSEDEVSVNEDEVNDDEGGFSEDEVSVNEDEVNDDEGGFSEDEAKASETGYDLYNKYYLENNYRVLDSLKNGILGYFGLIKKAIEDNKA